MTEHIRVEITEQIGGAERTYAAEALSRADAVEAVIETMDRYEQWLDEIEEE